MKLFEKIYEDILKDIASGKLKAGDLIPTEYQLMQRYNVSRITVSRAVKELQNSGYIIRKRKYGSFVADIADKKENQSNKIIALIAPYDEYLGYSTITGSQEAAIKAGYCVAFYNSEGNFQKEREIIQKVCNIGVAGIILFPCAETFNYDLYSQLMIQKFPLVFIDRLPVSWKAPLITSDNFDAAYTLTQKLIEMGHRNIAFFELHNEMLSTEQERLAGYLKALIDHEIPVQSEYLYRMQSFPEKIGYTNYEQNIAACIDEFFQLPTPPSAVICLCDESACQFVRFANIKQVKIPDMLSVASFDNSSFATKSLVPLTTMEQNFARFGSEGVGMILDLLKNKPVHNLTIKMKFILRQSVQKIQKEDDYEIQTQS